MFGDFGMDTITLAGPLEAKLAEMEKRTDFLKYIVTARQRKEWVSDFLEEE